MDVAKLARMGLISTVPLSGFWLPVLLLQNPALLPSTFATEDDRRRLYSLGLATQKRAVPLVLDSLAAGAVLDATPFPIQAVTRNDYAHFVAEVKTNGGLQLAQLPGGTLRGLARFYGLAEWGGRAMQARRLAQKAADIAEDSNALARDNAAPVAGLKGSTLREAAFERGMRVAGVGEADLRDALRESLVGWEAGVVSESEPALALLQPVFALRAQK